MASARDWLMPALLLACVCLNWTWRRCQPVMYENSIRHVANVQVWAWYNISNS